MMFAASRSMELHLFAIFLIYSAVPMTDQVIGGEKTKKLDVSIIIFLIFSLVDNGCKSENQAKKEKRRPPGTVEFTVSKTAWMTHLKRQTDWLATGGNLRCTFSDSSHVSSQVGPNDSLNSIALKFNITPNKLVQLNKLFSRSVYPGQVRTSAVM